MAKVKILVIALAGMLASAVLVAVPTAHAAGETWKVLSVDSPACTSGAFDMTVEFAGLDASGDYVAHTIARSGGLVYMNEEVTNIDVDDVRGWSLFDLFNYGPVPNPGTWPIPEDQELRVEFRLERPKGTVLYSWTLAVDGCNTGDILYNGLTSRDADKDNIPTPQDRCPTLKAPNRVNGCPLIDRTLTISFERRAGRFVGFLTAEGAPKLQRNLPVTVFKVRPGPDLKIGRDDTSRLGKYVVDKDNPRSGRYYAKTPAILKPLAGEAKRELSPIVRVR